MAHTRRKERMFIGTMERFTEKNEERQVRIVEAPELLDAENGVYCITFEVVPFLFKEKKLLVDSAFYCRKLSSYALKRTMLFS